MSAVYHDTGGEGSVIHGGNGIGKARSMLGGRGRWSFGAIKSRCNGRETNVPAGVVSGKRGGRRWSCAEVPVWGGMGVLISRIPLSVVEARVRRDGRGGWSSWQQIFMRIFTIDRSVGAEGVQLTRVRVATVLCGSEAHVHVSVRSGGSLGCEA